MHGVLTGAILGMAMIAFMGAYRSVANWRGSKRRPAKWAITIQVGLQVFLGLCCLVFGLWFLLFGE